MPPTNQSLFRINSSLVPNKLILDCTRWIFALAAGCWLVSIPNSLGLCQATNDSDANGSAEKLVFFENKIRPVLVEHCYACHSQEAVTKGKLKANLFLDSREGMMRGGDTGPSIVPGKPNDSLLLKALHYEDYEMPPSGKLPASILENFERWIADGAADPRRGNEPLKQQRMDLEAGRQFWSLQPLRSVQPPGASHPIDAFIHAELVKKQISPSPTADARVLVRRAWFDLLGLPPTPQELQHALETLQPRSGETGPLSLKGWNEVIDGLLERPEYGERWARHWMDVVRFAESFGYEQDYDRPTAYHYRDFLIRAFNEDMPFDQFTRWQIAGDELAPERPLAWMATGFLGAGAFPTQLTEREFESARYDELDDMTATTGVAFLGLSIGCARCHDHKFDPISSEDYYRFASSFTTAIRSEKTFDLQPEENEKKKVQHAEDLQELRERLAQFEARELVEEVTQFIRNRDDSETADPSISPWTTLRGDIQSSSSSQFRPQTDGSYLAVGEAPANEVITFIATIPAGEWTSLRIEALADPSLPHQGPGRAENGNFALGNLLGEHLSAGAAGPNPKGSKPKVTKLILDEPRATHQQNTDSLSIAASIDSDLVSGWAVDGQIGKSHAAVFHIAKPVKSSSTDQIRFTLRFHHPNGKHAMGRIRFSISNLPNPAVEIGSSNPPRDIVEAIETLSSALANSQSPDESMLQSTAWQTVLAWYKPFSSRWNDLHSKLQKLEKDGPSLQLTKILVTTEGEPHVPHHADGRGYPHFYQATHWLRRGDVEQKVSVVTPGVPSVFVRLSRKNEDLLWDQTEKQNTKSSYRRASLAMWLTDTDAGAGPLVARVIANRLWQHHLGRGLVSTPNDFGSTGQKPTHPDLLEWLATDLIEQGWKLKALHKRIMTSQTYRLGYCSAEDPRMQIDPDNQLWWHRPPRRLEAEAIRDSLLAVSDMLDRTMYGPGTLDPNMKRRSVYFFIKRSQLIPMMMLFDWPEHLVSIAQRQSTTIAPQALALMNHPLARSAAESLADEFSDSKALDTIFLRVLSRPASQAERESAQRILARLEQMRRDQSSPAPEKMALADFCQILLCCNEFIYVD